MPEKSFFYFLEFLSRSRYETQGGGLTAALASYRRYGGCGDAAEPRVYGLRRMLAEPAHF
jgi:hypothetical protein